MNGDTSSCVRITSSGCLSSCAGLFTELVSKLPLFGCFSPAACCGQGTQFTSGVSAAFISYTNYNYLTLMQTGY